MYHRSETRTSISRQFCQVDYSIQCGGGSGLQAIQINLTIEQCVCVIDLACLGRNYMNNEWYVMCTLQDTRDE